MNSTRSAQALRPWDEVGTGMVGPARATFRLSETESDDPETSAGSSWRLEFLLQSTADPSLLVPAEQAWTTTAACAGGWTGRRSCCSPSWAGPAGSIPSSRRGLRSARPCGARPRRRRRLPVPVGVAPRARRGRASACCCRRGGTGARRLGLDAVARSTPGRRGGRRRRQVRPRAADRLPLAAGRRRRHAHRRRDRRAGRRPRRR